MPSRVLFRNPYPVPDVSSEGFWLPPGPVLGNKVTFDDRRWTTKLDIHERLFAHHTLNSIRRDQRFVKTKAPNDALDLALTSAYVHNEDTLVPKMYVSMQPESLGRETWRVLRNELKTSSPQFGIPTYFVQNGQSRQINEQATSEQEYGHEMNKMAARTKMAAGSKMASRAISAPARSSRNTQVGQLHKYAGRTRHDGIPDRIESIHPSSLKLGIGGPHTDQTNAGYSRKDDGTFYGV